MPRRDDMTLILCGDHCDYPDCGTSDVLPSLLTVDLLFLWNLTIYDCLNTIIEPNVARLISVLRFVMPCVVDSVVVVSFGGQVIELYLSVMLYFGHFVMNLKNNYQFCYQNRGK